jgi:hypothetical protein
VDKGAPYLGQQKKTRRPRVQPVRLGTPCLLDSIGLASTQNYVKILLEPNAYPARKNDMALKPIVIKRYKNEREYQRDAQKMTRRHYRIQSVVSEQQRNGFMRLLLIGFFFPPKAQLIVTYSLV